MFEARASLVVRRLRRGVDAGFLALGGGDRGRGTGQRVGARGRLGEGDDLADRFRAGQEHDHAVPAEGDAAVRWRAVLERVEQEAELGAGLFLAQPDYVEDLLLHGLLVYTDRAAADLVAVADHVVGVGQRGAGLSGELVHPIRQG